MSRQNKENKVSRYRLTLADDATHDFLKSLHFKRYQAIIALITVIVVLTGIYWCIFALTPLKTAIPGYPDAGTRKAAVSNAIKIDSLERSVSQLSIYTENLVRLLEGREGIRIDSIFDISSIRHEDALTGSQAKEKDSLLRAAVKADDDAQRAAAAGNGVIPVEGMHFFPPVKGVVAKGYDSALHPYIDVTAPASSVVMSVLDGTVVFAGWNDDGGYTIAIQHQNDIISIYKHNEKALKSAGERVTAGTPIALVGSYGNQESGDHLRFELWYQGKAVDPTEFISF